MASSSTHPLRLNEETEKEIAKTQTKPKGVDPQKKKISSHALDSRIVLVSPYKPLNDYIAEQIPEIIKGGFVDIVDRAEQAETPFIDVESREKQAQTPYWVIDFGKIVAPVPSPDDLLMARTEAIRVLLTRYGFEITDDIQNKRARLAHYPLNQTDVKILTALFETDLRKFLERNLSNTLKAVDQTIKPEQYIESIILFKDYREWALGREITCIIPKAEFASELEGMCSFTPEGNFEPHDMDIGGYTDKIVSDLKEIANNWLDTDYSPFTNRLQLFKVFDFSRSEFYRSQELPSGLDELEDIECLDELEDIE